MTVVSYPGTKSIRAFVVVDLNKLQFNSVESMCEYARLQCVATKNHMAWVVDDGYGFCTHKYFTILGPNPMDDFETKWRWTITMTWAEPDDLMIYHAKLRGDAIKFNQSIGDQQKICGHCSNLWEPEHGRCGSCGAPYYEQPTYHKYNFR